MLECKLPSDGDPYSDAGDENGEEETDGSVDQDDGRLVVVRDGRKGSYGAGHEGSGASWTGLGSGEKELIQQCCEQEEA
jgi:hypothetical protein